ARWYEQGLVRRATVPLDAPVLGQELDARLALVDCLGQKLDVVQARASEIVDELLLCQAPLDPDGSRGHRARCGARPELLFNGSALGKGSHGGSRRRVSDRHDEGVAFF